MADLCKYCNSELNGNFCSNCGLKANLERIDRNYIKHEIVHVLHLEKGFFYTVKELLIRPGKNVREFIFENRTRLVKPILFIIITSLFYTFVNSFLNINEQYVKELEDHKLTATKTLLDWVTEHYGYANILMAAFIVPFIKRFFKNYNYNFYEILILLCFVMGMGMLILTFFILLEKLTHFSLFGVSNIIEFGYSTFAVADFFDRTKPVNYIRSFFAYFLGMAFFALVFGLLGGIIDLITNYL